MIFIIPGMDGYHLAGLETGAFLSLLGFGLDILLITVSTGAGITAITAFLMRYLIKGSFICIKPMVSTIMDIRTIIRIKTIIQLVRQTMVHRSAFTVNTSLNAH